MPSRQSFKQLATFAFAETLTLSLIPESAIAELLNLMTHTCPPYQLSFHKRHCRTYRDPDTIRISLDVQDSEGIQISLY